MRDGDAPEKKGLKVPPGWKRSLREWMNSDSVYRVLNQYGTSYWQALLVLGGMILLFSWVFLFSGFQPNKEYSTSSNRVIEYVFT
ncbi:MAG: hypothetical protein DMF61_09325 [Blastocatellia bacterium AA13]|nr:MAG: hypothetical protein DMF61_09325 [Blastocatellia bacterium AA13]